MSIPVGDFGRVCRIISTDTYRTNKTDKNNKMYGKTHRQTDALATYASNA